MAVDPNLIIDGVHPRPPSDKKATPEQHKAWQKYIVQRRRETAKQRRTPTCGHLDRQIYGKTGVCYECFIEKGTALASRPGAAADQALARALKLVDKYATPEEREAIRSQALALLMENLPNYARLHMEASKNAALKGNAEPIQWALTSIKGEKEKPVVDPPQKIAAPADTGVKVFVGVNLGGISSGDAASKALEVRSERTR